jgi:hypothetical protein
MILPFLFFILGVAVLSTIVTLPNTHALPSRLPKQSELRGDDTTHHDHDHPPPPPISSSGDFQKRLRDYLDGAANSSLPLPTTDEEKNFLSTLVWTQQQEAAIQKEQAQVLDMTADVIVVVSL